MGPVSDDRLGEPDFPPLTCPPAGSLLDAIALFLEGGGSGRPADTMLDLREVLDDEALARLDPRVTALYAEPQTFQIRAGLDGDGWSRTLLALFAKLGRQSDIVDRVRGFEGYPVGQLVYVDPRGRVHWDRYARIDKRWRRLFLARISGARGTMCETFAVYGIPVPFTFRAAVEDGGLVLTLVPKWTSPASWWTRVVYRTHAQGDKVVTRGEFRIPTLGLYVRTEFHAIR